MAFISGADRTNLQESKRGALPFPHFVLCLWSVVPLALRIDISLGGVVFFGLPRASCPPAVHDVNHGQDGDVQCYVKKDFGIDLRLHPKSSQATKANQYTKNAAEVSWIAAEEATVSESRQAEEVEIEAEETEAVRFAAENALAVRIDFEKAEAARLAEEARIVAEEKAKAVRIEAGKAEAERFEAEKAEETRLAEEATCIEAKNVEVARIKDARAEKARLVRTAWTE